MTTRKASAPQCAAVRRRGRRGSAPVRVVGALHYRAQTALHQILRDGALNRPTRSTRTTRARAATAAAILAALIGAARGFAHQSAIEIWHGRLWRRPAPTLAELTAQAIKHERPRSTP